MHQQQSFAKQPWHGCRSANVRVLIAEIKRLSKSEEEEYTKKTREKTSDREGKRVKRAGVQVVYGGVLFLFPLPH